MTDKVRGNRNSQFRKCICLQYLLAPVGQWDKRWPANLAVADSIPGFNSKRGFIAHSLSLSPSHRPDTVEKERKRKCSISRCLCAYENRLFKNSPKTRAVILECVKTDLTFTCLCFFFSRKLF